MEHRYQILCSATGGRTQFSRALLLMRLSARTRIAKGNMPLTQRSCYLLNARSIFPIFFVIERSALMALVFYNKRMLEKLTMQGPSSSRIFPT